MRRILLLAALPFLGGGLVEGNRLYRAGQFRRAAEAYQRRVAAGDTTAAARYNLGTALLRLERWDTARALLESDTATRREPELRQRALYNAGNADLEPVFRRKVTEADARRERLLRSIARYKDALLARPGDADAKWNLELAQRLLRDEPKSGGGGGADQPSQGGGGGGQQPSPQPAPQPAPAPQQALAPELSEREAERILTGASQAEAEAQREVLSRVRGQRKSVRDW